MANEPPRLSILKPEHGASSPNLATRICPPLRDFETLSRGHAAIQAQVLHAHGSQQVLRVQDLVPGSTPQGFTLPVGPDW